MLTELATIKARLGLENADTDEDVLLSNFLAHASGRFEKECNRLFERTVDFQEEFGGNETELRPSRCPVESVSAFALKTTESEGWIVQTGVDCLIRRGCVISLASGRLGSERTQLRVTYTGGYVMPGTPADAGQTALPAELEQACVEQVTYWYQRRTQLGLTSISGEGGSIQNFSSLDLLPHVKAVLKRYERILM
jgi:hypothetical protein